jgi:hypothetical protein
LSQWRKAAGDGGEVDLFRARRDQIINLKQNLVQLRGKIDRDWFDREIADPLQRQGRAANASQFVIGLFGHINGLSNEDVCER